MSLTHNQDWENFWQSESRQGKKSLSWSKKRLIAAIAPYLSPGKRALDAGCGSGFFAQYFLAHDMQSVALDFSEQALKMVTQLTEGRVQAIKADLLNDQLAQIFPDKFDLIFSDGLFEHFERAEQGTILRNLLSVLAENGVLITVVPNIFSPWQLIRPFFMPGIKERPFTLAQLKNLYAGCGLQVIDAKGLNVLPISLSPDHFVGHWFGMVFCALGKKAVSLSS